VTGNEAGNGTEDEAGNESEGETRSEAGGCPTRGETEDDTDCQMRNEVRNGVDQSEPPPGLRTG
jgi:hypothetical protein